MALSILLLLLLLPLVIHSNWPPVHLHLQQRKYLALHPEIEKEREMIWIIFTWIGLVEVASVDEPVNLQLDAVAGLGQEPAVPAVLMFVQFQRFDLTVAET